VTQPTIDETGRPTRRRVILGGAALGAGAAAMVVGSPSPAGAALPDSMFYNPGSFAPSDDPVLQMPPYVNTALGFDPTTQQKAGIMLAAPASWAGVDIYLIGAIDNTSGLHDGQVARLKMSNEADVDFTAGSADTWQGFRQKMNPTHVTAFNALGGSNWRIAPFSLRRLADDVADTLTDVFYVFGLELVETP
jgi:hypothetical protein